MLTNLSDSIDTQYTASTPALRRPASRSYGSKKLIQIKSSCLLSLEFSRQQGTVLRRREVSKCATETRYRTKRTKSGVRYWSGFFGSVTWSQLSLAVMPADKRTVSSGLQKIFDRENGVIASQSARSRQRKWSPMTLFSKWTRAPLYNKVSYIAYQVHTSPNSTSWAL